jgi:hypothetical protein
MRSDNPAIIADATASTGARVGRLVFTLAMLIGAAAALYYARLHLTLSHYDARAHLVVARRVIDSLTPGWRQFGAVWLPLPHLLNALPVQIDWSFRTGFSAVAISVIALSWGLGALAQYLYRHTHSVTAAVAGPSMALLNPNILYLQSTPMTEALLFGLSLAALLAIDDWMISPDPRRAHAAGLRVAALALTRYEGWFVGAALVLVALAARRRERSASLLLLYPAGAVIAFLCLSYLSSGVLLVTSGFFVPENPALGNVRLVADQLLTVTRALAGPLLIAGGAAGIVAALRPWRSSAGRSLLVLSLLTAAVLPFGAFYDGHPVRVRYMVPLVLAAAALSGFAIALVPARFRAAAGIALVAAVIWMRPPLSAKAPMVVEAQWETPYRDSRRAVSEYLRTAYDGTPILASMGSLAHYMQESSAIGLHLANFVHEGNGDLWMDAFFAPRHHVRWILIEERAEGGDVLAGRARDVPGFLDGFTRVMESGGLVVYRRTR